MTAEYKKKKVDKRKLLEYAGVTYPDFDSVSQTIVHHSQTNTRQIYASMDELIFAPIRAEEAAERALEAAKKAKEPKKETESKKADKEKANTASELDEDKENKDQNVKGKKKKQTKQPAITVNELLEQKSIVNEDLLKKELDDAFDVDVEVEQEVNHSYIILRINVIRRPLLESNARSESEMSTSNGKRKRCRARVNRSYLAKQSNPSCISPLLLVVREKTQSWMQPRSKTINLVNYL